MSRKVPDSKPAELDPKQMAAIESLLAGTTVTAAAKAAGVNRRTLWRWTRFDVEFRAVLNGGRLELREAAEIRLSTLADSAISVVEEALGEGDVRTALAVLRGLGLLSGQPVSIGSDDSSFLATQARADKAEKARQAQIAELTSWG